MRKSNRLKQSPSRRCGCCSSSVVASPERFHPLRKPGRPVVRTERAQTCLTGQQRDFLTVFYGGRPGGRTCRRKRVAGSGRSGYTGRASRDYKRDEKGRFAGGGGGGSGGRGASSQLQNSPHGTISFKVRGFRSKLALYNLLEFGRTQSLEYERDGIRSKSDYEARALALCESAVSGNILGHADKNGFVIRYDRKTNDFAKGHPLKGVSTMFKPTQGETYYKEQRERDLEHGGTA